jgi:hypothetical protein
MVIGKMVIGHLFIRESMVSRAITKVYVYKTMYTDSKMQIPTVRDDKIKKNHISKTGRLCG